MAFDIMEDELVGSEENVSLMFTGKKGKSSSDEELALHIIHKFNICEDTMKTMPALEEHLKPLFLKQKE